MRRLLFYFLILLASVWVGVKIHKDPGYVLVTYQKWSLETTLWFAILAILLIFLLLYFLIRLLRNTSLFSDRLSSWSENRKTRKAGYLTHEGLCQLAEGDWKMAQKNLIKGVAHSEMPLINYLAAASAVQRLGEYEQRDSYLREAHNSDPKAEMAIGLTQAQLQLNSKQWELALATLRHLHQINPNHAYVLKLLERVYKQLHDWESLRLLLPGLRKKKILRPEAFEQLEKRVYFELLNSAIVTNSHVEKMWQSIPHALIEEPKLVSLYVDYLMQNNQSIQAENLLRDAIKEHWDNELIERYGKVQADEVKQLNAAEVWLKNHSEDPVLLCCLGRLCFRNKLWGKARSYFQTSLQLLPNAKTYQELGELYETMNEPALAVDCYKKGIQLIDHV